MKTLNMDKYLELYRYMVASRESDIVESELVNSGEANFLASSKGHEGSVILAPYLLKTDYLHCHYRDKALMLARGVSNEMFFYSALAKEKSHSHGRQMVSHMSAPELNILSIVGPVGNNALQAAGIAHVIKDSPDRPIVYCAIGDGTSQQGEVLEAIAEACRSHLPILFFIHNNELAISTRTNEKTFFSLPKNKNAKLFYDIPITYLDGTHPFDQTSDLEKIVQTIRDDRKPHIIVFNVDRLDNHSNADDHKLYRSSDEFTKFDQNDPLNTAYIFLQKNGFNADVIEKAKNESIEFVRRAVDLARLDGEPAAIFDAERPLIRELMPDASEYRGDFTIADQRYTMLEAMRAVFDYHLASNPNVCLLGEDIEDGKGDVFGITRGLSTKYGSRVKNSALSESTIVGLACGMALAGKLPVAFIQFADFMPIAYNQIFSELATMYWRTAGAWQAPVIVFAASGAYRPGLGPFHSQTNEATYAHIPGLDVYVPSNAADAAGMLNAAFRSGRPSIFLYPKKLLNNASISDTTSRDINRHLVPIGRARIVRSGGDITLVGWGNTVELCIQAADTLDKVGIESEIIDLRTIKPYDLDTILISVQKTRNLIVTHEDNHTCGLGGEIIAAVAEYITVPFKVRRITRPDTYTPCNFANQLEVLPSYEKILAAAAQILDLSLIWEEEAAHEEDVYMVNVIGASPSDESVLVNKLYVGIGSQIKNSDVLVDIEASKSAGEILSPCAGIVEEIYVSESERAVVGAPLLKIRLPQGISRAKQYTKKTPTLKRKVTINTVKSEVSVGVHKVGLSNPTFKTGSRLVENNEILLNFPDYTTEDIVRRTGIKQRFHLAENESVIDIAVEAVKKIFEEKNITLGDIDLIICATTTPEKYQSPSMACLIMQKLYASYGEQRIAGYDINAACSGYIYALQNAKDYLQTRPDARVLVITAENMSVRTKNTDFETAFLFADAASATILYGNNHLDKADATLDEVFISAIAEDGSVLNIPTDISGGIQMQGKKLFTLAVKNMAWVLRKCCTQGGVNLEQLDLVVPHQANQRILNAVGSHLGIPEGAVYSNIEHYANTSSCTIPIALSETLLKQNSGNIIALCAFGGGFTSAAALLTRV
ncbi:MAG: transketolase [Burkholderiales bacterium]|jgi:2-oxoisovalerate dehydrogenase E1 component|nr:transketolase [Burkholderiales bacterium]